MQLQNHRNFLFVGLALAFAAIVGCGVINSNPPTTQPTLTPAQQQQIAFAQGLQQDADLANDAFQAVALADPSLAAAGLIAAKADKAVDSGVATYIADVEAGGVPPAELIGQIEADLAQVLTVNSASPVAAANYVKAKAQVTGSAAKLSLKK